MATTYTKEELVSIVKAHAYDNYTKGWDIIVECYTDAEICQELGGAKTKAGAIAKFGAIVNLNKEAASNCW